jgi:hypothetical protein
MQPCCLNWGSSSDGFCLNRVGTSSAYINKFLQDVEPERCPLGGSQAGNQHAQYFYQPAIQVSWQVLNYIADRLVLAIQAWNSPDLSGFNWQE